MNAVMRGQRPDRIPILPFAGGFCAKIIGEPIARIYDDPEKSFWAQIWTRELLGYDGYPMFGYASLGAWEFGGEVKMPESEWEQAPMISKYPVRTPEEVDALAIPDVETAGFYPLALRFARIQRQFSMPIQIMSIGGFTPAGNIVGLDKLCRWMVKQPEVAHRLLRKTVVLAKKVVDYYLDTFNPHPISIMTSEASAGNQIISPQQFEEFALPYLTEVHEYYLERGIASIFCHICGEQNLNLPYWQQLPCGEVSILSFGHEVDLTKAIEIFGDKHIIAGNVEPRVIREGTWQDVYELARICIEKAKYAPRGYMLMAGCDVPPQAPPYNIYTLKKAVMDYGFYD
jgi:uroporphyrinogen decarboxylase